MKVTVSMLVGSPYSKKDLVEKSVSSILSNIGTDDFLLVIGVSPSINSEIVQYLEEVRLKNHNTKIVFQHCFSFAGFHNYIFLKYGTTSKWFIISHDDIELKTGNLIDNVEKSLDSFTNISWISFTDDDYLQGHWAPSIREGFHSDYLYEDAWLRRKLFQFHLLEEGYWKKGENLSYFSRLDYDFPISPVKCHAPFSHFIMIEAEKLKKIGLCENWSKFSLLIDEDWGLSALKEGLINIWIPDIIYTHIRETGGTRSSLAIEKEATRVHGLFTKKWGFSHPPSREDLKKIKRIYGNTNIVWSFDRKSFEWDYLK